MTQDAKPRRSSGWTMAFVLALALVAYPLSLWPVCYLSERGVIRELDWVYTLYAPLDWASAYVPGCGFLNDYARHGDATGYSARRAAAVP